MSYGASGWQFPPNSAASIQIAKPMSAADNKFGISIAEVLAVAERLNLDVSTITSVVQIQLRNQQTMAYINERVQFQIDASTMLAPNQQLRVIRRPRGISFGESDVEEPLANRPTFTGQADGSVIRDSTGLTMNTAPGSASAQQGAQYRVSTFSGGTVVLQPVSSGSSITVQNGEAQYNWLDTTDSIRLPTLQLGSVTALPGNQMWEVQTSCSEFIFAGQGTTSGGAIGDPYIKPVVGNVYKLRSDPQSYRLWSDQHCGGDLVVNGRVDHLQMDVYRSAAGKEKLNGARHGGMGSSACFMRYVFVQHEDRDPLCVDLETLKFVRPKDGTWDYAVRTHNMAPVEDPAPWDARVTVVRQNSSMSRPASLWNSHSGIRQAYSQIRTQSVTLELRSRVFGLVKLICSRYPNDPSVRTGVHVDSCLHPSRSPEGVLVRRSKKMSGVLKRIDDRRQLPRSWADSKQGRQGQDQVQVIGASGERQTVAISYVHG